MLVGLPVEGITHGRVLAGVGMFWLGSLTMASLMATLFVLSRYATTYEAMIGIPLVLLSDVFGHPPAWTWFDMASAWLPTAWAARLLFDPGTGLVESTGWFVTTVVLWALASAVLGRAVLRRATRHGTLEVV
jgi:ABC-2 type transport system permease protein